MKENKKALETGIGRALSKDRMIQNCQEMENGKKLIMIELRIKSHLRLQGII